MVNRLCRELGSLRDDVRAIDVARLEAAIVEEVELALARAAEALDATIETPDDSELFVGACDALAIARGRIQALQATAQAVPRDHRPQRAAARGGGAPDLRERHSESVDDPAVASDLPSVDPRAARRRSVRGHASVPSPSPLVRPDQAVSRTYTLSGFGLMGFKYAAEAGVVHSGHRPLADSGRLLQPAPQLAAGGARRARLAARGDGGLDAALPLDRRVHDDAARRRRRALALPRPPLLRARRQLRPHADAVRPALAATRPVPTSP